MRYPGLFPVKMIDCLLHDVRDDVALFPQRKNRLEYLTCFFLGLPSCEYAIQTVSME